jgi:hypothetical protein
VAGRRVLITGVANPFGARLAQRLVADDEVERVVGALQDTLTRIGEGLA